MLNLLLAASLAGGYGAVSLADTDQLVMLRVPLPTRDPHSVSPLMDYQDCEIAMYKLRGHLEEALKKHHAGEATVDDDALARDKLVMTIVGPSADKIATLIIQTINEDWYGKAYLTKRYDNLGPSKSFVLQPGRRPKPLK